MAGVLTNSLLAFSSSSSLLPMPPPVSRSCLLTGKLLLPASTQFSSPLLFLRKDECSLVAHAVAEVITGEPEIVVEEESAVEEKAPLDEVSKLKLESDLLKKKVKRAELRRKRLVRKRHLRKKGRWPPSKMAKLKNV